MKSMMYRWIPVIILAAAPSARQRFKAMSLMSMETCWAGLIKGIGLSNRSPMGFSVLPVSTQALRLQVELVDGFSAGLYEWEVSTDE